MSTLKVDAIENDYLQTAISLNSTGRPIVNNLIPNIISREGANSTPLLSLESFNEVHYYTQSQPNNLIQIRTSLVQNALYELWSVVPQSDNNIDISIQPNGQTYANEFNSSYYADGGSFQRFAQPNQASFYFDHYGGGNGNEPVDHFIISTGPTNKYVQIEGSDSDSLVHGYSRWTNNSRTWSWFGTISYSANSVDKRVWIRRIG